MQKYEQEISLFLSGDSSHRARQVLGNGLVIYEQIVDDVLSELRLLTANSTASRAFSIEYKEAIRRTDVISYLRWLSTHSNIKHEALLDWVFDGICNDSRIRHLAADRVFPHTAAGLADFDCRINGVIDKTSNCISLAEKPSASFLPPDVRQPVCKLETATMAAPLNAFRTESSFAAKRFNGIHERNEGRRTAPTCILSWLGVDAVMKSFRFDDQRDSLVESLLGSVDNGYLVLGMLDDRPNHRGALVHSALDDFDIRAVVNNAYSIRRHRQTLHRYLFDASDSTAQAAMVAEDATVIEQAKNLAMFDLSRLNDWLLEYASDNCWRKRKKRHDENWDR